MVITTFIFNCDKTKKVNTDSLFTIQEPLHLDIENKFSRIEKNDPENYSTIFQKIISRDFEEFYGV